MKSAVRIASVLTILACAAASLPAAADEWPTKPIRILVGFGPGGGTDIVARILAQPLSELLGQPVVVENKPGAAGTTATDALAKSAKDGYTAVLLSGGHSVAAVMYKSLPYDSLKDIEPVSMVATAALAIAANRDGGFDSLKAMIAKAKAQPGKLNYATIGVGSTQHFSAELFRQLAGVDIKHIPYRNSPAAIAALRSKEVDLQFDTVQAVLGQVKGGDLKALAVTSSERWPALPDVPTVAEQGVTGYEVNTWYGMAVPAGTPAAIVEKLNKALKDVLARDGVRKQIGDAGAIAKSSSPREFGDYVASEIIKWRNVRDKAGIQPQ
jgi:tripartite-type tricarboxylate transporter receptor subunit TctC